MLVDWEVELVAMTEDTACEFEPLASIVSIDDAVEGFAECVMLEDVIS